MNNVIKRVWKQGKMVTIESLNGMTFQDESNGHTFAISAVDENGNAVSLAGTPTGNLLRADNQDVALTCSVANGVVYATLPANAYSVPGRFAITVFLTSDGQTTAIFAAIGIVSRTDSGEIAPPAGSNVTSLVNAINTAVGNIPVNFNAAFAPAYSDSGLYSVGQYVTCNGTLYRCITPVTISGTWSTNSSKFTAATLGNDVYDLKSALSSDRGIVYPLVLGETNYTIGKYIDKYGVLQDDINWCVTEKIPVSASTGYNVDSGTRDNNRSYIVAFDSSDAVKDYWLGSTSQNFTTPAGTSYIRFAFPLGYDAVLKKSSTVVWTPSNQGGIEDIDDKIDDTIDELHDVETISGFIINGYFINGTGTIAVKATHNVVCYHIGANDNLIDIISEPNAAIYYSFYSSKPGVGSSAYDGNREYISSGSATGIVVPNGCTWIAVTMVNTSFANIKSYENTASEVANEISTKSVMEHSFINNTNTVDLEFIQGNASYNSSTNSYTTTTNSKVVRASKEILIPKGKTLFVNSGYYVYVYYRNDLESAPTGSGWDTSYTPSEDMYCLILVCNTTSTDLAPTDNFVLNIGYRMIEVSNEVEQSFIFQQTARRPIIAFMFDGHHDTKSEQVEAAMWKHGMVAGFAPVYSSLTSGQVEKYLIMQNKGHEIISHGSIQLAESIGDAAAEQEIRTAYTTMAGYGFRTHGYLSYQGEAYQGFIKYMKQYFDWAASTANHFPGDESCVLFGTDHPYKLWRYSMDNSTLAQQKSAVDRCIEQGGLLLLYAHANYFNDGSHNFTSENIEALLTYIDQQPAYVKVKAPHIAIRDYFAIRYDDIYQGG